MDPRENSSRSSVKTSSSIKRKVSLTRSRRATQGVDDRPAVLQSSNSSSGTKFKQMFTRRPSISDSGGKRVDIALTLGGTNNEATNTASPTNTSSPVTSPSTVTVMQRDQQASGRPQRSIISKIKRPQSGQYQLNSPSQTSFPLAPTEEEPSSNTSSATLSHSSSLSRKTTGKFPKDIINRDQSRSPQRDDKNERTFKKTRVFSDSKHKSKARIMSLISFIDASNELDQAQFFQDHSDMVFDVMYKAYVDQTEKIRQRTDRPIAFSSKEFAHVNRILLVLRRIFLYLPDRIRKGWHKKEIAEILNHLLEHRNHPRIRIIGFQLLLLWLNDQTIELAEAVRLYANAISLDLFVYDHINSVENTFDSNEGSITLRQELIKAEDRIALFPNPQPPTLVDAIALIKHDLSCLARLAHVAAGSTPPQETYEFPVESLTYDSGIAVGMGIDAAFAAAKFHFDLFKKHYLVKLFPACAKKFGLLSEKENIGFRKCPPTILRILIQFFIDYSLDNNHLATDTPPTHSSPATPILKSILLTPENREFIHEILRQALILPPGSHAYKDIVRGAVHIIGMWILSGEEERPSFLRKTVTMTSSAPTNISIDTTSSSNDDARSTDTGGTPSPTLSIDNYTEANKYLQRYIELLSLIFEDHPLLTPDGKMANLEPESQVAIYKDTLSLFRAMVAECTIELEPKTWEIMLANLLEIQHRIMNQNDKYGSIRSVTLADDFVNYLVETIFNAFVRSMSQEGELWQALTFEMSRATRWSQTISQWRKIMIRLTRILSKYLYQVDLDALETNRRLSEFAINEKYSHRRLPSKNKTRHLSLRESRHKTTGSSSSREEMVSPDVKTPDSKPVRRAVSIHQDMSPLNENKILGGQLFNFMNNGFGSNGSIHSESIASEDETEDDTHADEEEYYGSNSDFTPEDSNVKSNRTSASSIFTQHNCSTEKLSNTLGNFRYTEFLYIERLPWTSVNVLYVWKNMLVALGNVNSIEISPNHSEAIKGLVELWGMLSMIRNNQPYDNVPLPSLYSNFAPWFFEACDMPAAYAPGRAQAYAGMCKMMSRRHEHPLPSSYYAHFYRLMLKGLAERETAITSAIINNSTRLFAQGLPGCQILVSGFIESVRNVLTQTSSSLPELTRQNAITILCSLICVVGQSASAKVPVVPYNDLAELDDIGLDDNDLDGNEFGRVKSIRLSEVRLTLKDTLIRSLETEESVRNADTHIMLLYGICTLAYNELTSVTWPHKSIVKECFHALVDQLYWNHLPVVAAAADCLSVFAQNNRPNQNDDAKIYTSIIEVVLSNLVGALDGHLNLQRGAQRNGRGFIITKLFQCLNHWLMAIPPRIFIETELYQLVFDVIGLTFEVTGYEPSKYDKLLTTKPKKSRSRKTVQNSSIKFEKADRRVCLSATLNNEHGVHVVGADYPEDPDLIKDVAECILLHLTHHLGNFSPIHGAAMTSSSLVGPVGSDPAEDELSEHYQYFSINDTTIITLIEVPGEKSTQSRMIIRDITGRYAWDSRLFFKAIHEDESSKTKYIGMTDELEGREKLKKQCRKQERRLLFSSEHNDNSSEIDVEKVTEPSSESNDSPISNTSSVPSSLDDLLTYIGTNYHDCSPSGNVRAVTPTPPEQRPRLDLVKLQMAKHIKEEISYENASDDQAKSWYDTVKTIRNSIFHVGDCQKKSKMPKTPLYSRETSHLSLGADFSLSKSFLPCIPCESEKPTEPYQHCRLLLSHLGWLTPETFKDSYIFLLRKSAAINRDLKLLDKRHPREVIKIAVLYVGAGQEDESSILRNVSGSAMYDEFVSSLGWEVDLATHTGYVGGLERTGANGKSATYYCDSSMEIIFHDVTKMPNDPSDVKMVKKKRHIGNDHVHIVWNEHWRDYKKNTIKGDFGNAVIVVNPLPNGLFSVDVHRDSKVTMFGPISQGMVVSKTLLGPLIRATAVQAFRNCLHSIFNTPASMYRHSYIERRDDLSKLVGKHRAKCVSYAEFMSKILAYDDTTE
ncbi:8582_t:CDS:10 [Paraglomus occultum]|uniref:8582_t:CDS:1 n=1 Tax=Paraglomus occultum TaxID=144539 RepID=A0A9N8W428_9GLOM|nr:8582_t:CDS:10 [Paraglomus occultum]